MARWIFGCLITEAFAQISTPIHTLTRIIIHRVGQMSVAYIQSTRSMDWFYAPSYKKDSSTIQTTTLYALPKDSIRYYRKLKYADRISNSLEKKGIVLEVNNPLATAELTIKSFDKDLLQSEYQQEFDGTIKTVFQTIQTSRIHQLILDVRNNQGGDFEPCRKLLSYLISRPLAYLEHGEEFRMVQPDKNAFKGKLYILVDGGSFSSAGILCAYLDVIKRAVFIGEETGGNRTLISGNSAAFILPNTKIVAEIAQSRYRILNRPNDGQGLLPTYLINPSIADIISNKDPVKAFAIALISKTKP
jgi:C-terminal processing protease CtpA/Prc